MAWADGPHDRCLFWLSGMAGIGKSTIARTVAKAFNDEQRPGARLGASFFFSRGQEDRGVANKFFTSLAAQLTNFSPALRRDIYQAIEKNCSIAKQSMRDQWNQLIFKPLKELGATSETPPTIVVVIDALDECDGQKDVDLILRLLAEAKSLVDVRLRVYITSRPEDYIRESFTGIDVEAYQHLALHDVAKFTVDHDISVLFRHELGDTHKKRHGIHADWADEKNIELLTRRADGLFIYAATACRYVKGSRRETTTSMHRLLQVLQGKGFDSLDKMYTQILLQSVIDAEDGGNSDLSSQIRQILGHLVTLFDSVPAMALSELCSMDLEIVWNRLDSLQSVLVVPESEAAPIRIFHPSFRDFLLERRCSDSRFWIDDKVVHRDLFNSSVRLMSSASGLKRDICGMYHPGAETSKIDSSKLDSCLPIHTRYACRYWVDHLEQLGNFQREEAGLHDNGQVHVFLQKHFLHWLEALSLMGKVSKGVLMITALQSMLTVSGFMLSPYNLRR